MKRKGTTAVTTPQGFLVHTAPAGLADDGRDDFTVLLSTVPSVCAAVFTQSRFAGPSVVLCREETRLAAARGVVVVARNANVATGPEGDRNAREVRRRTAEIAGLPEDELLIASTGVIGKQYPMVDIRTHLDSLSWPPQDRGLEGAAEAIMTTDTHSKIATARCGDATVTGIAKGVGMLEPDMATLLTFFATDAELPQPELDRIFRRVMDVTFNAVSIDTDTSTSDTAAVFANGLAGPVDAAEFERALHEVALTLVRMIAKDGEGAGKLIEIRVTGARDTAQAKRVGKTVVNSPLVKTAVHGSDPNWGRVAMAIGKCQDDTDIVPEKVSIGFGGTDVYPAGSAEDDSLVRKQIADHLRGDEVLISIGLGIGEGEFTVYGCDLTPGYVRLNSEYTT
ncbi:bifunctional glutamate N-acetyltransferase/amino-acid acetyltransferase ArgJ [Streptomyces fulvorobeus]|uniref:bifunctional glutamate N-acetyltransferase/amino-acid acetyltransferase ArgJ n=1 Tax=Streptomyces fulvorobeus TaxID=284028 RepID=UPI0015671567|nr:bifunctional glutamate N-acetyltransferase/amino-acid acetyltransferase ArgJ [Streptomyces fulvorobeus]